MFKFKRLFVVSLVFLLVLGYMPSAEAVQENPIIKVGLFYRSTDVAGSNLQNFVGLGYRFGYMGSDNKFVEIGQTSEQKISMVKNRIVYFQSSTSSSLAGAYVDSPATNVAVGDFHEDTGVEYTSYSDANTVVTADRAAGKRSFVSYINGKWRIRSNNYLDNGNGTYVTGSKYCISVVITGTNDIIFQFDGDANTAFCVLPDITGKLRPLTYCSGFKYAGGFQYKRINQDNLTVINYVTMQDYAKGVIPYEMSASWPFEALKAQAVCAKSYATFNSGKHKNDGFDVCKTTHCQAYKGTNSANANSDKAVDDTYGGYIIYNSRICDALYMSSDGGYTEDSENVYGTYYAYLRGVPDNFENLSKADFGVWQYTYSTETLSNFLTGEGYAHAGVKNFYVSQFTKYGNVLSVTFEDNAGKKYTFSKNQVRLDNTDFGVRTHSLRFTIASGDVGVTAQGLGGKKTIGASDIVYLVGSSLTPSEYKLSNDTRIVTDKGLFGLPITPNDSGIFTVSGRGNGHNLGMSQWGARGMAERGYTYDQILKYYYSGVTVTTGVMPVETVSSYLPQ